MLAHVLVPLDGSALSEAALDYARNILHPKGRLTLLTAVELPVVMPDTLYPVYSLSFENTQGEDFQPGYYSPEKLVANAQKYLDRIAEGLRSTTTLEIATHTQIGNPAELIIKIAAELKVDAIAMSTHGRSGFQRWLFGSVTNKVMTASPCPIFVIPSKEIQDKVKQSTAELQVN
jgi:nucleotide-binding universal stress UspA family protein